MKYLLRYTMADDVDPARLRELFGAHRQHWASFVDEGSLLAIGPMENPADGALGVFTTREAAQRFAAGDPFVLDGAVAQWVVAGWNEVLLGSSPG